MYFFVVHTFQSSSHSDILSVCVALSRCICTFSNFRYCSSRHHSTHLCVYRMQWTKEHERAAITWAMALNAQPKQKKKYPVLHAFPSCVCVLCVQRKYFQRNRRALALARTSPWPMRHKEGVCKSNGGWVNLWIKLPCHTSPSR